MTVSPRRSGIVLKHPPHRMGRREHPSSARFEHTRDFSHGARRIRDEGDGAESGEGSVEGVGTERQLTHVGLDQWDRDAGARGAPDRVPEHPGRQVERHHLGVARGQIPGARGRAAPDLQDARPGDVAEQSDVAFPQVLRTPDEVSITQECAVLQVVFVGVGIPPAPVGRARCGLIGGAAARAGRSQICRGVHVLHPGR